MGDDSGLARVQQRFKVKCCLVRKISYRFRILGTIAGLLLIVGMWPTSYLASPRWEVWVITEDGQPIRDNNVRLVYQNYSAESESHEVTLKTDDRGQVEFPPNYEKACFLQRALYSVSAAGAGVHASFGRHAYVFAFGNFEGSVVAGKYVTDWSGTPDSMQSRIVAKRTGIQ